MYRPLVFLILVAVSLAGAAEPGHEELILSAQARGVLAHHCTKCHGQQKQKGGLRLDTREGATRVRNDVTP
ncbi:MAG: c-type cytochrome domain-containing protein, partial [Verrucomicrobiota bacterium]